MIATNLLDSYRRCLHAKVLDKGGIGVLAALSGAKRPLSERNHYVNFV